MKQFPISLEFFGSAAMWTRPDTGGTTVSSPYPTNATSKGVFETIVRLKMAKVVPTEVEIDAPRVFRTYTTIWVRSVLA